MLASYVNSSIMEKMMYCDLVNEKNMRLIKKRVEF